MSALPPGFQVDSTLGAVYIGNVVVAVLFGVTSVQAYYYFSHYPSDKLILRATIAILWIIDFLHLFCVCHAVYYYSVTNFTNLSALVSFPWSFNLQYLVETVNDVIIRLVLLDRLWRLSHKNRYICGFTLGCAATLLALAIFLFVIGIEFDTLEGYRNRAQWAFYALISLMVASDIVIATSLCVYLTRHPSDFKRTRSTVNKIMLYTINTTALTSVADFICLITFATKPSTLISVAIIFILPKLYLNSLLGLLNSRKKLRDQLHNNGAITIPLNTASTIHTEGPLEGTKNGRFIGIRATVDSEIA